MEFILFSTTLYYRFFKDGLAPELLRKMYKGSDFAAEVSSNLRCIKFKGKCDTKPPKKVNET